MKVVYRIFEFLTKHVVPLTLLIALIGVLGNGAGWIWQRVDPVSAPTPLSPQQITTVVNAAPEWVLRLIVESRTAETAARAQTADIANRLSVTSAAVQTFFSIIGESGVQERDVRAKLVEVATSYISLRESVSHLQAANEETADILLKAIALVAIGNLRDADASLSKAETAALVYVQSFSMKSGDAYRAASLTLAGIRATRGDLALTRLNYDGAVARFNSAIDAVNGEEVSKGNIELQIGDAYYRMWNTTSADDALRHSVSAYSDGFQILNKCFCSVNDFAHHAFQFGSGLMKYSVIRDDGSTFVEAGKVFQSALDQRENRLSPVDIMRAKVFLAEAYALDLESGRDPGFSIDNFNHASAAVQAAGDADANSELVPEEERYRAKLMLARAYAQLAKQSALEQDAPRAFQLSSMADRAIEDATHLSQLPPTEAARLELARSENAETKATLAKDLAGLEKARQGFGRVSDIATQAKDYSLARLAQEKEYKIRGKQREMMIAMPK